MITIRTGVIACTLVATATIVRANNDLSSSARPSIIAPPSVEHASSSSATAVGVNQGRASHSIPITAPPGRSGLEPNLALVYQGTLVEGDAGTGWSLAVPRISVRTTGRGGQPNYGVAVTYQGFSGEDLVDIGALPDVDGDGVLETAYREERDLAYVRYVELSAGGWRAYYADGRTLTLGVDSANRIVRSGQATWIAAWLPETLSDPSGNELVYTWATASALEPTAISPTARYLTEIRYACSACRTASAYQQISLAWTLRTAPRRDFSAGFLVETELVLDAIATTTVVGALRTPVRNIRLAYDTSGTRTLLTAVTTTGSDGTALPPVTFTYTDAAAPSPTKRVLTSAPTTGLKNGVQLFDLDLDGRKDLINLSSVTSATWHPNTGVGAAAFAAVGSAIASPPGKPLSETGTASLDDSNRDNALDVFDLGVARLYQHDGIGGWDQTGTSAVLPAIAWSTNTLRFDVNGDGHNDLVDTSVSPWVIYLDDGMRSYTSDVVVCTGTTPTFGAPLLASSQGVLTGDVNGDGFVDIIYIAVAKTEAYVFYGRGRQCWGLLPEDGHGASTYEVIPITSTISGPTRSSVSLADVTGDGYDDLVMFDATAARLNVWKFSPVTGWSDAGMGGPYVQSISSTNGCRIADVDSDAIDELVCSSGWNIYDWGSRPMGLLASAANGRGATTTLAYTTSAVVAAQHSAAGHAWDRNIAAAIPLVATTESADGRGNVLVTSYDYRNAAIEVDELEDRAEFAGFEYIAATAVPHIEYAPGARVVDPQDPGTMTRTWFDLGLDDALDWYRHGVEVCTETWPATATPTLYECGADVGALRRVESTYTPEIDATGIATVLLDARDEYVLEGQATGVQLHTEHEHDEFGNVIATYAFGRWDGAVDTFGSDEQAIVTDYIVDTAAWNLRLPKRVQRGVIATAGGIPAIVAEEIRYLRYDNNASWDVATVSAGLRTATDLWTYDPISGASSTDTVERVVYTSRGLPDLVTDAAGVITDHDYDSKFAQFEVKVTVDPSGLGLATSYNVDPRTGVVTRVVAPDGSVTTASYDLLGRMTALVKPGDTATSPTLTRTYVDGAPISTVTEVAKDGTANGLISISQLDAYGRLVCTTKEAVVNKVDVVAQREYSAAGRVVIEWLPARETACEVVSLSATGRASTRSRDEIVFEALGRPVRRTHQPSATFRSWVYEQLAVTEADEDDNDSTSPNRDTPVTRSHDGRARIIAVTETLDTNGDAAAEPYTTSYQWTARDQLAAVVDPLGATVFDAQYDSRGRRVRTSDPDRGAQVTTWDAMDRVATTVDARGAILAYAYDAAGRVESVTTSLGGVAGPTTSYHYDAPAPGYDVATCQYTRGRLAYVEDETGMTVTCYDANGHAIRIDKTIDALGPSALRLDQTFDTLDRPSSLTHPDGSRLTWSYGKDGWASKLTVTGSSAAGAATVNVVSSATYNAAGEPLVLGLGNGSTLRFEYDDRLRPARLATRTGATLLQDLGVVLDGVGNVEAITDASGTSLGATFTYDALGRLTSASGDRYGGHTATYAYDLRGNLLSKTSTDTGSAVDVGTITYRTDLIHAVDTVGSDVFAYDAAGNLVDDGAFTYDYDAHGMLSNVSSGGVPIVTNGYDHAQRRVVKDSAVGADVYYMPEASLEIRDGVHIKRIGFAGRPILRLAGTFTTVAEAATKGRFLVSDHLGSPTLVLDTTGNVVERWAAHPHGEDNDAPFVASGHAADFHGYSDPATVLEHRFQGREINAEDGSYDFGARVYRADLGRFMSPDNIVPDPGSSQSWNRYAFARNNPIANVDPSGHADVSTTQAPAAQPSLLDGSFELKHDASGATLACTRNDCSVRGAAAKDLFAFTIARDGGNLVAEVKGFGFSGKLKVPQLAVGDDMSDILEGEATAFSGLTAAGFSEWALNTAWSKMWPGVRPYADRLAQHVLSNPGVKQAAFELYSKYGPAGAYRLTSSTLSTRGIAGALTYGSFGEEAAALGVMSRVGGTVAPPVMAYPVLLKASPSYQRYLEEQAVMQANQAAQKAIASEDFMSAD